MASNESADLNVVNKNRKLDALHDGTLLSNPRILKAFLLIHVRSLLKQLSGLSLENGLLAITSVKMMALNQNLAHIWNSSPLTFYSINSVLISHVIYHVIILGKIINYRPVGGRFKKRNRAIPSFLFILNISNTCCEVF